MNVLHRHRVAIVFLIALRIAGAGDGIAQEAQEAQPAQEAQEAEESGGNEPARPSPQPLPPARSGTGVPGPSESDRRVFTLQDRFLDAARRGDLAMLELCLKKGVDPRTRDELGRSALALAVRDARSLEVADFLRARDLPVDEPDAVGRSPLHEAAGNGDPAMVAWLLLHGAKPDRKDMQGRTPLHNAVPGASEEVALLLLTAGADVNARDNFAETPLIGACSKGLEELARLLAGKGADPSLKDQEGRTARERATETAPFCRTLPATESKK